jgi:chromosome segregation ATPase
LQLERTIDILKKEINRLHQDLLHLRNDLKLEKTKSIDLNLALRHKEKELYQLQNEYDREMEEITSKLLLLEGNFLKEQNEILLMLESKDQTIEKLQEEVRSRDRSLEERSRQLDEFRVQIQKELKARDKRIASQWRELEGYRSANNKFLGALTHLKSTTPHIQRSASNLTRPSQEMHTAKPRNAVSPNAPRKKFKDRSEWKEELSAFF